MSLAFVRGIHQWLVNSLHKGPVTRKMFPFDDFFMSWLLEKSCAADVSRCSSNTASVATCKYRKVSNIRRTLVGNKIVDHSDVVGASPVGAAPTTSS